MGLGVGAVKISLGNVVIYASASDVTTKWTPPMPVNCRERVGSVCASAHDARQVRRRARTATSLPHQRVIAPGQFVTTLTTMTLLSPSVPGYLAHIGE